MPAAPDYDHVDADAFAELVALYRQRGSRRIDAVHLHHTYIPDHDLYHELSAERGGEAAGLELCRRMWRYHTQDLGWSDIGQHVTVDPGGRIWLNRSWQRPPASAAGFNGSRLRGPLMIEMIGNFDAGRDTPTDAQRNAMLRVVAAFQHEYELGVDTLLFHNELTDHKTCPGSGIDKNELLADLKKRRAKIAESGNENDRPRSPFAVEHTAIFAALTRMFEDARDGGAGARASAGNPDAGAEPPESAMPPRAVAALSAGRRAARGADAARGGGGSDDFALTPAIRRTLQRHVINLRQGEFSNDGDFTTTREQAEALVNQHLDAWVRTRRDAGKTPHVLVYAHGGVNAEAGALRYAATMIPWWLEINVYPIFFVWETGAVETFWQLLEDRLGLGPAPGERGLWDDIANAVGEARDAAVEAVVRSIGRPFWDTMKLSAERASEAGMQRGAHRLAQLLEDLNKTHDEALAVHAVGHSAGAIFHSYFMRECNENNRRLPIRTLQFLAPACSIALFDVLVVPRVNNPKQIDHFSLYALDRISERNDPTVPGYGKSLLYLVSRGFEKPAGTPILGLEESVLGDPELSGWLGLGAQPRPNVDVIWAPGDERSGATEHGAFDNDPATLRSVARRMLGGDAPDTLPPTPFGNGRARGRASTRLFAPLSERLDPRLLRQLAPVSFGAPPATAAAAAAAPVVAPAERRRALCVGIDAYADENLRLAGCVNDARAWGETLRRYGFDVYPLYDGDATRDGILTALRRLIDDADGGDVLVFLYAGHGAFFPDDEGDEYDGNDEALVPVDYAAGDTRFIADDELWTLLRRRDDLTLTVFTDCCHSGSITRMLARPGRARQFQPGAQLRALHRARLARSGARARHSVEDMRHVHFAACQDNQYAYESDGHGHFTRAALAAFADGGGLSNDAMRLRIEQAFPPGGSQHPKLECRTADKTRPFLHGALR